MIRKIRAQEEIEREKRRNKIIIGVVMIALIVLSSLGYAIMNQEASSTIPKVKYGNLVFVQNAGYWQTQFNNKILYFNNLPQNLTNVSISENISLTDYYGKVVYIVNSNPAVTSISSALDGIALKMQEACMNETECIEKNLPKKDCQSYLIIYEPAETSSVEKIDNCVYLKGDFFASSDRLVYRLFNIA